MGVGKDMLKPCELGVDLFDPIIDEQVLEGIRVVKQVHLGVLALDAQPAKPNALRDPNLDLVVQLLVLLNQLVKVPDVRLPIHVKLLLDLNDLRLHVLVIVLGPVLHLVVAVIVATRGTRVVDLLLCLNDRADDLLLGVRVDRVVVAQRDVGAVLQEPLQVLPLVRLVKVCEFVDYLRLLQRNLALAPHAVQQLLIGLDELGVALHELLEVPQRGLSERLDRRGRDWVEDNIAHLADLVYPALHSAGKRLHASLARFFVALRLKV